MSQQVFPTRKSTFTSFGKYERTADAQVNITGRAQGERSELCAHLNSSNFVS